MKILLVAVLLVIVNCCYGGDEREVQPGMTVLEMVKTKAADVWNYVLARGQNEDTFIGRCFGVARKLKFIMPLIIFKLGVIVTTLAFLTIFSLKSIGLLLALVMMKVATIAGKFAAFKSHDSHEAKPQNVHFHIHQTKDGLYHVGHSSPGGWDKTDQISPYYNPEPPSSSSFNLFSDRIGEIDSENPELLNLYDKLSLSQYGTDSSNF